MNRTRSQITTHLMAKRFSTNIVKGEKKNQRKPQSSRWTNGGVFVSLLADGFYELE
jgi:hypothetical protein